MLQLSLRSLVIDVSEAAGVVTASARAEMRSADAVLKAKSILDGLRALASLSDDPNAKGLLDGLTVTSNGLTLEVAERCNVEIELGQIVLPKFDVPEGRDSFDYLVEQCEKGLARRYDKVTSELQ